MSNAVKRQYSWTTPVPCASGAAPERRTAVGAVAASLAGLGGLTLLLPGPFALTGSTSAVTGSAIGQALLSAAGMTVWALLGWHLLIVATALLGRLPGRIGRGGRALLRRLAPWTAARVVAAAVGLTLLSGTGACAAGLTPADDGAGPSGGAGSDRVITSMSIDWPDSGAAEVTPATTGTPTPTARAPAPAAAPSPAAAPVPAPDVRPASDSKPAPAPAHRHRHR